jgi:hypothetical protein
LRRIDPGDWSSRPRPRAARIPSVTLAHVGVQLIALAALLYPAFTLGSRAITIGDVTSGLVTLGLFLTIGVLIVVFLPAIRGQAARIVIERRLAAAFIELGVASGVRSRTPAILGSAIEAQSVLVRVWLPVGLTAEDVSRYRGPLAEVMLVDDVRTELRTGSRSILLVYVPKKPRPTVGSSQVARDYRSESTGSTPSRPAGLSSPFLQGFASVFAVAGRTRGLDEDLEVLAADLRRACIAFPASRDEEKE